MVTLMKDERLKQMEEYIKENEICHLDTLCEVFNISKVTVRRDLEQLCKSGNVEKTYGGVRFVKKDVPTTIPYMLREAQNTESKEYIGRLAADIIMEGDTIFIDSGTTTLRLVKYLQDKKVNVVTNSLNAVLECSDYDYTNLIVSGGEFNRITESFVGDSANEHMGRYNVTKAFLAATGASLTHGFTNSAPAEAGIKKEILRKSCERYIMLDYSKWNVVSLITYGDLTDVDGVITDREPPREYMELFMKNRVKVIY